MAAEEHTATVKRHIKKARNEGERKWSITSLLAKTPSLSTSRALPSRRAAHPPPRRAVWLVPWPAMASPFDHKSHSPVFT